MIEQILDCWRRSNYDFRKTANPNDPLRHLFNEWVDYYKLKRAIASVIQPASILEIGVRYGYAAMAFLDELASIEVRRNRTSIATRSAAAVQAHWTGPQTSHPRDSLQVLSWLTPKKWTGFPAGGGAA